MPKPLQRAIYQLNLSLVNIDPPITRQFQLYEDTTLPQLHRYIQALMNWEHYHLHEFVINGRVYAEPDPEDNHFGRKVFDERRVKLNKLVKAVGTQFEYHYDFGDGWEHDLMLSAILLPTPGLEYPRCVAAARNAPPEDAGGPFGYLEYVEALRDRMHERHREMRDWRGPFDPEFCSVDLLNERLKLAAKLNRVPVLEPIFVSPYNRVQIRGRSFEIELNEREHDLIVNHTLADEELLRELKTRPQKQPRKYRFDWDELDDLAGYVVAELHHSKSGKLKQEWTKLYEKFTAALDSKPA